jgi:hypothetical protein
MVAQPQPEPAPRYVLGTWPLSPSRLLLILALVFFVIDAVLTGGVFSSDSGWSWLLPGGLAAFTLSFLVP